MTPIPQEWIKDYVDKFLEIAREFDGPMREAILLRVEHVMDMVEAFHQSGKAIK